MVSTAGAADWPRWLGPNYDGIAAESLDESFSADSVLWRVQVGIGFSSIAIAGDRVLTMGHDGNASSGKETLWCLDAADGSVKWSTSWEAPLLPNLHEGGPAATPTIDGDQVIVLGKNGKLSSFGLETGKLNWRRDLLADTGQAKAPEWGFAGSPLRLEDLLIVEAGMTLALDPETGDIRWRSQPFRAAYGSPAPLQYDGRTYLAVLKTEGLVVLDAENGGTMAFEPWETAFNTNATTPIVDGDSIFISTGYDRGAALFQFDGRELVKRYENQSLCTHMNNAVLIDGYLYGFDGTAHRGRPTEFVCLEWESGKERWRVSPREGLGCGSLIGTSNGKLLILTEKGELAVAPASPRRFDLDDRAQVLGGRCWTPPALAGGRFFARNSRGDLVCVGSFERP